MIIRQIKALLDHSKIDKKNFEFSIDSEPLNHQDIEKYNDIYAVIDEKKYLNRAFLSLSFLSIFVFLITFNFLFIFMLLFLVFVGVYLEYTRGNACNDLSFFKLCDDDHYIKIGELVNKNDAVKSYADKVSRSGRNYFIVHEYLMITHFVKKAEKNAKKLLANEEKKKKANISKKILFN